MRTNAGWKSHLRGDPLPWLLKPANPSARYLTLRHVLGQPEDDPEVAKARAGILDAEPATSILAAQWPDGYWVTPDRGYTPRYRVTVWQIMFLAQLGAPRDERIQRACEFVWDHSRRDDGLFTPHQNPDLHDLVTLNGNLLQALSHFGYTGDPRMAQVLDALAALDLAPLFEAGQVDAVVKLACGLRALPAEPPASLRAFLGSAASFVVEKLPAAEERWLQFGFPLAEEADLLEMLDALGETPAFDDPRASAAAQIVISKQNQAGRWVLEAVPGKMWASFGGLEQANKWVTLRVLRVLRTWVQ